MNDVFPGQVLSRKLDGAFVAGPVSHPELEEIDFKTEELILVSSGDERSRDVESILTYAPLITFPEGSVFRRRLELLLSSKSLPYADRLTVLNSLGAMIANICAGIGFGYLPRAIVQPYLETGAMTEYPLADPFSALDVVFIHRKDHIRDASFRCFLEMLGRDRKTADG